MLHACSMPTHEAYGNIWDITFMNSNENTSNLILHCKITIIFYNMQVFLL